MAQAATATTDDLLSQLASSEIDRLLAEADGNPAPPEKPQKTPPSPASPELTPTGSERAALLQAAGFDSAAPQNPPATAPVPLPVPPPADAPPLEDERAALLHAAGFESPNELPYPSKAETVSEPEPSIPGPPPAYLLPLVWINAPLASRPTIVRQVLGKVGIVTLLNALAVLAYVFFFRKH